MGPLCALLFSSSSPLDLDELGLSPWMGCLLPLRHCSRGAAYQSPRKQRGSPSTVSARQLTGLLSILSRSSSSLLCVPFFSEILSPSFFTVPLTLKLSGRIFYTPSPPLCYSCLLEKVGLNFLAFTGSEIVIYFYKWCRKSYYCSLLLARKLVSEKPSTLLKVTLRKWQREFEPISFCL